MPASTPRRTAFATLLALLVGTAPSLSTAQYMYLDANGDGVNSSADVVAPTGTTTLEVWLKTDTNRDGTPAVCPTGEELTINSYEFILHAANGQMNWLTYTNLQPDMVTSFGLGSNGTDYHNGFGGGVILPRGTYHLGTLQVSVALGTPSLSIVAGTPLSGGYLTEFGSQCLAQDQDNTMKLGLDWFDVDGVAYGGSPQAPPVLEAIADISVNEASIAQVEIGASDADLQPLQFSKISGPPFMTVATLDPGQGTARGKITLTPNSLSAGVSNGTVRVTDGIASDEKSFTITVLPTNEPPLFSIATEVTLPAMSQLNVPGRVSDPDGDVLRVSLLAGPAYLFYLNAPSQSVGSLAFDYRLKPGANEVGREYVMLEATDGTNFTRQQVRIDVTGSTPAGPPPTDLFARGFSATELGGAPYSIAAGDFDGDGDADLAAALPNAGLVQIGRSDSKGGLSIVTTLVSPEPTAVAAGDLDHDGLADFAFVDARSGDIAVLRGVFAGDLAVTQRMHAGARPVALALGDMSGDGWLDAVVLDRAGSAVSVLLNDGTGQLQSPQSFVVGANGVGLALGEFSGEGGLDVAIVRESPNGLDVLINAGAGGFSPAIASSLAGARPIGIAAGDVDRDGLSDLAISRFGSPLIVMRSVGAGAFGTPLPIGDDYGPLAFADIDGDGNLDLLSSRKSNDSAAYVRFGTGTGAFSAPDGYFGPLPPSSLASGDTNGDGALDLVLGVGTGFGPGFTDGVAALYMNRGNGKLGSELISGGPPVSGYPVLADFNSDGHLDVAGGNGVNLGVGDGTFQALLPSLPATDPPFSFSYFRMAADVNGDGHLDLLSTRDGRNLIDIRIGDGAGHFAVPSPATLSSQLTTQPRLTLATGDLNEDGILDLVVGSLYYSQFGPGPMELWLGRGGGLFEAPTLIPANLATTSIRIDDVDEDGHQDIVVVDFYFARIVLVPGNGDGTFGAMRNLVAPSEVGQMDAMAWGDMNGDGRKDVMFNFWGPSGSLGIALQRQDHTFMPPRPFWTAGNDFPAELNLVDLDGDTHLDVVTTFQGSIALAMGGGNGSVGLRGMMGPRGQYLRTGDVNEDGYPDLVAAPAFLTTSPGIGVFLNNSEILNRRLARAFLNGGSKTIPVGVTGRDLCLRVEPVGGSYDNADIDLSSIVMKSVGTGSVNQIVAIPAKKLVLGDSDGNGVAEIPACFSSADLGRLFSKLTGRQEVPVVLSARLEGGGRMYSEVTLTIVHTGPSAAPSLSPNPLNPSGVFRFVTTRPGQARIQLFDVQGRLVRGVVDRALPAGTQEVQFDGKDGGGRSLASGIYFARVETTEGQYRMRVAIVK